MSRFSSSQKKELVRISISFVLFVVLAVLEHTDSMPVGELGKAGELLLWLVPYFIVGYDVVRKCVLNVLHGNMMDECFLMTLATIGAFGCGENTEAVAVMLFYQVGEFFQDYAVGKSRGSIKELMSIAPDYANRIGANGEIEVIDPDDIEVGDILLIKPGEKIPTDAVVVEGCGLINTSALTGESMPQSVQVGDGVISGCINGDGLLKVRAEKAYDDSTVMQILEMVENAANKKSKTESFITRFARVYTPVVVYCAVALAFLPPIFSGNFVGEFGKWVMRACTFLVISCPCALVISVPLAFFGGIGAASKIGVLVKGSNYLEMMANVDTVVSDKTGTLTEGKFRVTTVKVTGGCDEDELLRLAAAVESGSTHPIAKSICEAAECGFADRRAGKVTADEESNSEGKNLSEGAGEIQIIESREDANSHSSEYKISNVENISGLGMTAVVDGMKIAVGNVALMESCGAQLPEGVVAGGTVVYVAKDGEYIGAIELADAPKAEAREAIRAMFDEGVQHFVMLTGDAEEAATRVAAELDITEYRAQLLPQDKVAAVEGLLGALGSASSTAPAASESDSSAQGRSASSGKRRLAFIGDGINDAPVLSRADIGIAMGSLGSDAAIEAADIIIMDDKLMKVSMMIRIARRTMHISKSNIVFALTVKALCLVLGAIGIANMWVAVFADVGVAMICILNSMRMLKFNAQ